MNEQERSELERLKQCQAYLREQLSILGGEIKAFEARLNAARQTDAASPLPIAPLEIKPAEMPPLTGSPPGERPALPKPPPLPPVIPAWAAAPQADLRVQAEDEKRPPHLAAQETGSAPIGQEPLPARESSFEMRLGTYWLVRVGVVMLLTALAFFGYYAYEHYIPRLGPPGKVILLYLAGATLLGLGAWFQRGAAKESLRNYGQVVFAGGLAAVYFTTYAAHHFQNLRVIQSALLDGILLMAWAGVMIGIADRKRSEVLALFAVGLAYYASIITDIGLFTLYSNLVLTLAAVFFLVRNRWTNLSFISLVATYASYVFWRFVHNGKLLWSYEVLMEDFWPANLFLLGYWILFTAAVFLSKQAGLSEGNRASFLTVNNAALFGLVTLSLFQVHRDWFWLFSLGFGAILLTLAAVAARAWRQEKLVENSYLTQGLVLVTLGLIAKFSGLQLALLLAGQSVVLVVLGELRQHRIMRAGGLVVALLAVGWGMAGLNRFGSGGLILGAALGAMMTFNAWWIQRREAPENLGRVRVAYFTVLALLIWLVVSWKHAPPGQLQLVLAIEALVLTASFYVLRLREMAMFGQGYLALAHILLFFQLAHRTVPLSSWNPAIIAAITVGLIHWWQRQRALTCRPPFSQVVQALYALATVELLLNWSRPYFAAPQWIAFTSLFAVMVTAYGLVTRAWWLAGAAQLSLIFSGLSFADQMLESQPPWYYPLAPIGALVVLQFAVLQWLQRRPEAGQNIREPLSQVALVYRWVALAMLIWWLHAYIPAREKFWIFMFLGLFAFLWSGWRQSREALLVSAAFGMTGLAGFWIPTHEAPTVYWPNLLAILALLGQQQLARRASARYRLDPPIQACMIVLGGLSLWLFFSRWVLLESGGFYLTMVWSVLALGLFVLGLGLRERNYRWLGLAVLACALGRVVFFDVWKLETIYRVVSFMALGVVLLVLGFIYNKYLEKLKQWL